MTHPERIVPDETPAGIVALHVKRYAFAAPFADGRDVLDSGCGVGYGTAYLAARAATVTGIDVDTGSIEYARLRYAAPNLEFLPMDVTSLAFPDAAFDLVVSFETLEHVDDPLRAVREAARVLRDDGVYVVSTPYVEVTNEQPDNPFHVTEYAPADFTALLERGGFGRVELYGQHRRETRRHRLARRLDVFGLRRRLNLGAAAAVTGSPSMRDLKLDDVSIDRGVLDGASVIVAVCRR